MSTTVYFATNRVVTDANDVASGYTANMVPSLRPQDMTYGIAFVDGVDVRNNQQGTIRTMDEAGTGGFSQNAISDLSDPGRDLLVFVHGFANNFEDAITRAAFNREWISASNIAVADTTVICFSWPSLGKEVSFPVLPAPYLADELMARQSGIHVMDFLVSLGPILKAARQHGRRVTLLTHSMGSLVLDAAVESWFASGHGDDMMFDLTILAAGDCSETAFDQPSLAHLGGLTRLSNQVMICYSHGDQILQLSMVVNQGAQRLGQYGPRDRSNLTTFPRDKFQMLDCTQFRDYNFSPANSHQYYRMSPDARAAIVAGMGGGTEMA